MSQFNILRSENRGHFDFGWLDTFHTFSFGDYRNKDWMHYRALRVINQDVVQPGEGFGTHPHRDMEIITYVLRGALEHKDSMGNGSVIRVGDVQKMSAGSGITHSEFNHSKSELVELLQIWIMPSEHGIKPTYDQKNYTVEERTGRLRLIASPDGSENSIQVIQDARVYATILKPGQSLTVEINPQRYSWVQVARGSVNLEGEVLKKGDGASATGLSKFTLKGVEETEVLVFDLA